MELGVVLHPTLLLACMVRVSLSRIVTYSSISLTHFIPPPPPPPTPRYQKYFVPAFGRLPEPHWNGTAIPGYDAKHDEHVAAFVILNKGKEHR